MKSTKKNTIFVLLIMCVVFYFLIKDDYKNILYNLSVANKSLIILGLVFVIVYYALKARSLHIITREHKKDISYKAMFNQTLITQFFNGITPFSTGGQPMQIYMLNKTGINVGVATNIIIQDFLMYQLALITIGVFAVLFNLFFHFINISPEIYALIIAGFTINTIIGVCLLFISFSKRFNDFVGKLIIRVGSKLKIIKNREETLKSWEKKLEEFHESASFFKNKKGLFLRCYLYNVIALIAYYIIPFFIFLSFDPKLAITIPAVLSCSAFVMLVGNFVPIPGGSGGIEYSFIILFGSFLPDKLINSTLIIWRFMTYYLGVLVGGVALSFFKGSEKKCE